MEDIVERFKKVVEEKWNTPLDGETCIPRKTRKLVRDLLREYIRQAPQIEVENKSGRAVNLFTRQYVERNPVYKQLFGNVWLLDSAESIRSFDKMTTLGRFLLTVVYRTMTGGTDHGWTMPDNYDENTEMAHVDQKMHDFCKSFMWQMGAVSSYFKNRALFFGLPMYWWHGIDGNKLLEDLETDLKNHGTTYGRWYYKGSLAFVKFIADLHDRELLEFPHFRITFNDQYSDVFTMSIPEFVMDGLCYTVWDTIYKEGETFAMDLFQSPNEYNGASFLSVDYHEHGYLQDLKRPEGLDCGAIRVVHHSRVSHPDDKNKKGNDKVNFKPKVRENEEKWENESKESLKTNKEVSNYPTEQAYNQYTGTVRNHAHNGHYLYYANSKNEHDTSDHEYERRDRLTYDARCRKFRFWDEVDNDKTTYLRMLRDRHVGDVRAVETEIFPNYPGGPELEGQDPRCMNLEKLDSLIKPLEEASRAARLCCGDKGPAAPGVREIDRWQRYNHNNNNNYNYNYNRYSFYNGNVWTRNPWHRGAAIW